MQSYDNMGGGETGTNVYLMIGLHLNVSRIMVKRTNFPSSGTTRDVGGMISASRRKNTVRESRMLIERLT